MDKTTLPTLPIALFMIWCLLTPFSAVPAKDKSKQRLKEFSRRAEQSANTLINFRNASDGIPKEILENAKAIAIFPRITSLKALFGKTYGKGIVSRKTAIGWSAPASFEIDGGISLGYGLKSSSVVLVFMTDSATQELKKSQIELGKNVTIELGPRKTPSGVSASIPESQVLTYQNLHQRVFIDPNLRGAKLKPLEKETKEANCGFGTEESLFIRYEEARTCAIKNEGSYKLMQALDDTDGEWGCICKNIDFLSKPKNTELIYDSYPTKSSNKEDIIQNLKEVLRRENITFEPPKADKEKYIIETHFSPEQCAFGNRGLRSRFRFELFTDSNGRVNVAVYGLICSKISVTEDYETTSGEECNNQEERTLYGNGKLEKNGITYSCTDNSYSRLMSILKTW